MESTSSPTLFRLSSSIVLIWPNKWENKRKEEEKCSKAAYGDNCAMAAEARKEERKERITRAEYLSSTQTTLW